MPIRDDSLPILQGQGSDSFTQSHQSSVHPPSDEIIGSSTRLTSFPYQKNEPSKFKDYYNCADVQSSHVEAQYNNFLIGKEDN